MQIRSGTILKDRYEILAQIGEGGFATVYQARDLQLNRDLAIKILKVSQLSDDIPRFQREAQVLAQLRHKNIISVFAFDLVDESTPYLVMEFLPGKSLEKLLHERGRLKPEQINSLIFQLCDGLSYAHKAGIVHRDLSLANIHVVEETADMPIKILDFGLSRLFGADSGLTAKTLTMTGSLVGNLAFMSPEQARGERVDARSDIYAFGCLIYQCLCGNAVFEAESPMAMIYQQQNNYPDEPQFDWADSEAGQFLKSVALRCLQKNPDCRFQSCEDIRQAVASGNMPPVKHKDYGYWSNAEKPAHRNAIRMPLFAAAIVTVLLPLAIVYWDPAATFVESGVVALPDADVFIGVKEAFSDFLMRSKKPAAARDLLGNLSNEYLRRKEFEKAADCHLKAAETYSTQAEKLGVIDEISAAIDVAQSCTDKGAQAEILRRSWQLLEDAAATSGGKNKILPLQASILDLAMTNKQLSKAELRHWFSNMLHPHNFHLYDEAALRKAVTMATKFVRQVQFKPSSAESFYELQLDEACINRKLYGEVEQFLRARIEQVAYSRELASNLHSELASCMAGLKPDEAISLLQKARTFDEARLNFPTSFFARTWLQEADINSAFKKDYKAGLYCCNQGLQLCGEDAIDKNPRLLLTASKISSLFHLGRTAEMRSLSESSTHEMIETVAERAKAAPFPEFAQGINERGTGQSPREQVHELQTRVNSLLLALFDTNQFDLARPLVEEMVRVMTRYNWLLEGTLKRTLEDHRNDPKVSDLIAELLKLKPEQ